MITQEFIRRLAIKTETKIVMLIMDGLGGLPHPKTGRSELETAKHPHLDQLAKRSWCGLSYPVGPGITPGSGPGHLGLFGYDPIRYQIGRGLLDCLGIDVRFNQEDLIARGNFATLNQDGAIVDRRAGRLSTETSREICEKFLTGCQVNGVQVLVTPVKEHRVSVIFRGSGLSDALTDSDPQREGLAPLPVQPLKAEAESTAKVVNHFITDLRQRLASAHPANMLLLRGFSKMIALPQFSEVYKLTPAAIALYPMYRGLARLVGMKILPAGDTIASEFETLKRQYLEHDFFFIHIKATDSAGEDGDFRRKVKAVEEVDRWIPYVMKLQPDVLVVSGDHSTPAVLKGHSWHPVPLLIYAKRCPVRGAKRLTEIDCAQGLLGRMTHQDIMSLALANAGKLIKYGA